MDETYSYKIILVAVADQNLVMKLKVIQCIKFVH